MQQIGNDVSIKIQTGVYGQFRNLNNRPWYALAEFVDKAMKTIRRNLNQFMEIIIL